MDILFTYIYFSNHCTESSSSSSEKHILTNPPFFEESHNPRITAPNPPPPPPKRQPPNLSQSWDHNTSHTTNATARRNTDMACPTPSRAAPRESPRFYRWARWARQSGSLAWWVLRARASLVDAEVTLLAFGRTLWTSLSRFFLFVYIFICFSFLPYQNYFFFIIIYFLYILNLSHWPSYCLFTLLTPQNPLLIFKLLFSQVAGHGTFLSQYVWCDGIKNKFTRG